MLKLFLKLRNSRQQDKNSSLLEDYYPEELLICGYFISLVVFFSLLFP